MLRACRRVLRPGGRIAYYNIYVAPGLPERQHRRALQAGPSAVSTRGIPQADLLRRAGFRGVQETDVTREFVETARAWGASRHRHEPAIRKTIGDARFEEVQADSRTMLAAIEEGLLRRGLFVGKR